MKWTAQTTNLGHSGWLEFAEFDEEGAIADLNEAWAGQVEELSQYHLHYHVL